MFLPLFKALGVCCYGTVWKTSSDGRDKPFCTKAITIIDNFKKALGDTDNR